MAGLVSDLRFAARLLGKDRTFTAVAVLTLGLGIGAATAIFSVVHAVLLRPLPFPRADELVQYHTQFPDQGRDRVPLSAPELDDLARYARALVAVTGYTIDGCGIGAPERPVRLPCSLTTHGFAATMEVAPALGRWFEARDEVLLPALPSVVVIGDHLWRTRFAAAPDIVGRAVQVDAMPVTVVGVMPPGFTFPAGAEMWLPQPRDTSPDYRRFHFFDVVGRLAPGVGVEQARAELAPLMAGWHAAHTPHSLAPPDHPLVVHALRDEITAPVRSTLWLLQLAVLCLLLVAVANVANLVLARTEERARELAVRSALGAGRARLVRQLLTESLLLGAGGGALGVGLALAGVAATVALLPHGAPRAAEIGSRRRWRRAWCRPGARPGSTPWSRCVTGDRLAAAA